VRVRGAGFVNLRCEDSAVLATMSDDTTDMSDNESFAESESEPLLCSTPPEKHVCVPVYWAGAPWANGSTITVMMLKTCSGAVHIDLETFDNKATFPETPLPLSSTSKPVYAVEVQYYDTSAGPQHEH
jgi:hypothetical protein